MQKNDLNDILLQSGKDKKDKGSFLLIVAAVLIVFFIGIIAYKAITNATGSKKLPPSTNISAKSDGFTEITPTVNNSSLPEDSLSLDEKLSQIKNSFDKDVKTSQKDNKQTNNLNKTQEAQKETPKETFKKEPTNTVIVQEETPKTSLVTKSAPTKPSPSKPKSTLKNKFYIQVASFTTKPNKKITKLITDKGYEYVLREVSVKDKSFVRLYIGPYDDKLSAAKALLNVNKDIGIKNAFVIKDY